MVVETLGPTEGGAQPVVLTKEVYRNLHAVRQWQVHQRTFVAPRCNGGDGDGAMGLLEEEAKEEGVEVDGGDLVAALLPGRALTLRLNAQYAGWVNFVRNASITVQYLRVE